MTIRTLLSTAAAIAFAATSVSAQEAKPAKEKRVCKSAASIGTLVQQRTCRTASEWKAIAEANDRAVQQLRQENAPGTNPGPQ